LGLVVVFLLPQLCLSDLPAREAAAAAAASEQDEHYGISPDDYLDPNLMFDDTCKELLEDSLENRFTHIGEYCGLISIKRSYIAFVLSAEHCGLLVNSANHYIFIDLFGLPVKESKGLKSTIRCRAWPVQYGITTKNDDDSVTVLSKFKNDDGIIYGLTHHQLLPVVSGMKLGHFFLELKMYHDSHQVYKPGKWDCQTLTASFMTSFVGSKFDRLQTTCRIAKNFFTCKCFITCCLNTEDVYRYTNKRSDAVVSTFQSVCEDDNDEPVSFCPDIDECKGALLTRLQVEEQLDEEFGVGEQLAQLELDLNAAGMS